MHGVAGRILGRCLHGNRGGGVVAGTTTATTEILARSRELELGSTMGGEESITMSQVLFTEMILGRAMLSPWRSIHEGRAEDCLAISPFCVYSFG